MRMDDSALIKRSKHHNFIWRLLYITQLWSSKHFSSALTSVIYIDTHTHVINGCMASASKLVKVVFCNEMKRRLAILVYMLYKYYVFMCFALSLVNFCNIVLSDFFYHMAHSHTNPLIYHFIDQIKSQ